MDRKLKIISLPRQMMHIPISWARSEGWNPGLEDAFSFYAADAEGFLAGYLDDEIVASISAVKYDKSFGFIGFYIVDPKYRGMGFGRQIWNAALSRLQGRVIGLDGVVDQQDFYRRAGFTLAHAKIRYRGIAKACHNSISESIIPSGDLSSLLLDYDAGHFGFERKEFLDAWVHQAGAISNIYQTDTGIQAWGVIRKCHEGYKIGPLFADTYELAEGLFRSLISSIPSGEVFYLDIPAPNSNAQKLVQNHKMEAVFETARMYHGKDPELPLDKIFGITTFELG